MVRILSKQVNTAAASHRAIRPCPLSIQHDHIFHPVTPGGITSVGCRIHPIPTCKWVRYSIDQVPRGTDHLHLAGCKAVAVRTDKAEVTIQRISIRRKPVGKASPELTYRKRNDSGV